MARSRALPAGRLDAEISRLSIEQRTSGSLGEAGSPAHPEKHNNLLSHSEGDDPDARRKRCANAEFRTDNPATQRADQKPYSQRSFVRAAGKSPAMGGQAFDRAAHSCPEMARETRRVGRILRSVST